MSLGQWLVPDISLLFLFSSPWKSDKKADPRILFGELWSALVFLKKTLSQSVCFQWNLECFGLFLK